jgi:AcrR family transcriptional regulator
MVMMPQGAKTKDQLSAGDWLDQGLKALARHGFTALKADPLAKAMGVSRGSFYWHFADVGAFHAALLKRWQQVAAEQIIADVEAAAPGVAALEVLVRRVFRERLQLEHAVRIWASVEPAARAAVQAIDRRRLDYIERLLRQAGLPADVACTRARILYWAFLGFAQSDQTATAEHHQLTLDELLVMALRPVSR